MVVKMDESKLSTIEQIEAFLGASEQVAFTAHAGDTERYAHISRVLRRFDYQARRMRFTKTRPVCNPIGVRRAPRPQGRAGFVRIDTVLSGDIFTCVQLATSGFVTEMVPAGQARSAAQVYASTIATRALKWTPNLGQVFKWDTVQRNGLPMTESKKRRLHPPELKAKLGLEALGGMKTINQIALEHDVHPMQVRQWKRDIQDQAKSLFEGKRGPQPVSAASSPDRLYGEIGRLKMELDWLKKKSGISLP
jgi:transposase-like protein